MGKPGVLQSMGSQRVGHDLVTKQHWLPLPRFFGLTVPLPLVPSFHPSSFSHLLNSILAEFLPGASFTFLVLLLFCRAEGTGVNIRVIN